MRSSKTKVKEEKIVSDLAFLVENELEKASIVLSAKGILDKLQKMAEGISKIESDDLFPILDQMRLSFGPQIADKFNDVVTQNVRATLDAVQQSKQAITSEVGRLEAAVNGEPTNDLGMGMEPEEDLPDMGDDSMGDDDLGGDMGDGMGMEDQPDDMDMGSEIDAAFDSPGANSTSAGRARKESVQMANIKALRESKNPDRLIFETFRRTLRESGNVVGSAKAVARAFAIDYSDVVEIIKEGKSRNDSNRKGDNKKPDWKDARKNKDKERDDKLKEANDVDECDIEEGKTWKDDARRGNTQQKKGWQKDKGRQEKNRQREETDESIVESNEKQYYTVSWTTPTGTGKKSKVFDNKSEAKEYMDKLSAQCKATLTSKNAVDEGNTFKDNEKRGNGFKGKKPWEQDRREKNDRKTKDRREETDESLTDPIKSRLATNQRVAAARKAKGFTAMDDKKKNKVEEAQINELFDKPVNHHVQATNNGYDTPNTSLIKTRGQWKDEKEAHDYATDLAKKTGIPHVVHATNRNNKIVKSTVYSPVKYKDVGIADKVKGVMSKRTPGEFDTRIVKKSHTNHNKQDLSTQ